MNFQFFDRPMTEGYVILAILIAIAIFLLIRELWCWYFKTNKVLASTEILAAMNTNITSDIDSVTTNLMSIELTISQLHESVEKLSDQLEHLADKVEELQTQVSNLEK
jgi:predicted nuclease with TOPRIM domain